MEKQKWEVYEREGKGKLKFHMSFCSLNSGDVNILLNLLVVFGWLLV